MTSSFKNVLHVLSSSRQGKVSPKALNLREIKPEQKEAKQNPKEIRFHT